MKIILLMITSVDGKVTRGNAPDIAWASKEDRKFFVKETKKAKVIIMGRKTHETIGRALPERLNVVFTSKAKKLKSERAVLEFTDKDPKSVARSLARRGFKKAMLVGGPTLNSAFLQEGLIDEIWLTLEPFVFGKGLSIFDGKVYNRKLAFLGFDKLSKNTILLKYRLLKN